MNKKILILFIILIGIFYLISVNKSTILKQVLPDDIPAEIVEKIIDLHLTASLGTLCSGKIDGIMFWKNNGKLCVDYCTDNPENEVCSAFVPDEFNELPPEYSP